MEDPQHQAWLVGLEVREFIETKLHRRYPWMKTEAIKKIAEWKGYELEEEINAQDEATIATKERINFFDLPAELRNEIYELVLVEDSPITIITKERLQAPKASSRIPAILHASQQVRQEASSIYYASNIFQVNFSSSRPVRRRYNTTSWKEIKTPLGQWPGFAGPVIAGNIKELQLKHFEYPATAEDQALFASGARPQKPGPRIKLLETRRGICKELELETLGVSTKQLSLEGRANFGYFQTMHLIWSDPDLEE